MTLLLSGILIIVFYLYINYCFRIITNNQLELGKALTKILELLTKEAEK